MKEKNHQISKIITTALEVEDSDATTSNNLAFFTRALILATLPHKEVKGSFFERKNGNYTLTLISPPSIGLPFGSIPRLLITYLSSEAVKTKSREIELGDSMSYFMRQLGLVPTGGRWGSIPRLKEQTKRLFGTSIHASYISKDQASQQHFQIVKKSDLFWQPQLPDQTSLWKSSVLLSDEFYSEIISHPVPIDLRVIKVLSSSPLALDIYVWLTYRVSQLETPSRISWEVLSLQFGSNYKQVASFKFNFLKELKKVLLVYPKVKISIEPKHLVISPSATHVKSLPLVL